jgi:alkylhydroperoxidase family enzyme
MKTRGNIPNMFRTAAHRAEIMRTMVAHFRAVMETGTVPAKLKELLIVRTTQINRCEY